MPDAFLTAKLIHILAVILMAGATVINGLLHAQAKGSTPVAASALLKAVLLINRLIMGPSLAIIPMSGYWLMTLSGYGLAEKWLLTSAILSALLIIAYLVGLRLEQRLHIIAERSATQNEPKISADYNGIFLRAAPIGLGALVMSLAAIVLMIFKPF